VAQAGRHPVAEKRPRVGGILAVLLFGGLALAALVTVVYRNGKGTAAPAKADTVVMAQIAFHPTTLTVKKGAEVTWENKDVAPHNVEATSPAIDSGTISPGGSFRVRVEDSFDYRCTIHPGMEAKVVLSG
jgi:plastocyanin